VGKQGNIRGHSVHRSAEQGRALVEQWRQSGLSGSEFCRRQALGEHVLPYWQSREAKARTSRASRDAFYVVSTSSADSAQGGGRSMRGEGGAVIVVLPTATSEQLVHTLRGLLEEVRA
jgi:hypothetical protein